MAFFMNVNNIIDGTFVDMNRQCQNRSLCHGHNQFCAETLFGFACDNIWVIVKHYPSHIDIKESMSLDYPFSIAIAINSGDYGQNEVGLPRISN